MRHLFPLILICLLGLSGCSTLSYSVSEETLQKELMAAVEGYDRAQLKAGSPLALTLTSTELAVGPDGRDVVRLAVAGRVAINAFAANMPADVALSLEGTPYYDNDEGAIYLRRLSLLDSRVEAPWLPMDIAPVTDLVVRLVAQTLESVPVYRLDPDSMGWGWKERLASRAVTLDIEPGRLVLKPGL
ncbi:DUF1439 domain-containing protein [Halomonas sp. YLGW01]|uniref:DUF1439 domain-containing protein n=1 Tax=Halomonas sp. YLGW01 TaxID=2773308 RepID=UPI00177A8471|nr:DUF1439 domain-containing protein [Halomonas sp. YLGW01]